MRGNSFHIIQKLSNRKKLRKKHLYFISDTSGQVTVTDDFCNQFTDPGSGSS